MNKQSKFETKVIADFRAYLREEKQRLILQKHDQENLYDCKVFETSFVNRSDDAKKLKSGPKFD